MTSVRAHVDPRDWVRNWFLQNGVDKSLDECAKAASRLHIRGVHLALMAHVRMELKEQMGVRTLPPVTETTPALAMVPEPTPQEELPALPAPEPEAATPEEPPQTPSPVHMSEAEATPEAKPKEVVFPRVPTVAERRRMSRSALAALKRRYTTAMLDTDFRTQPKLIIDEIKRKFGSSPNLKYVYESARVAKEVNGVDPGPKRGPKPKWKMSLKERDARAAKARTARAGRKTRPAEPAAAYVATKPDPGGLDAVVGKWPGDETDAELAAVMREAPPEGDPVPGLIRQFLEGLKSHGVVSLCLTLNEGKPAELTYERRQAVKVTL